MPGSDYKPSIVVVEDDIETLETLKVFLEQHDFDVYCAESKQAFLKLVAKEIKFDLALLDIMLPDGHGVEICEEINKTYPHMVIILMTGSSEESLETMGLDCGADDFIRKPYNPKMLISRINSSLRRVAKGVSHQPELPKKTPSHILFGEWQLNCCQRLLVDSSKNEVSLSESMYQLLYLFLSHPKKPLSREEIFKKLGYSGSERSLRTIDIQVVRLRTLLREPAGNNKMIQTLRGVGYIFSSLVAIKYDE